MTISLTREEFLQRLKERKSQLQFPIQEIKFSGASERIFSQNEHGVNINLSEIMGFYLNNLIDVVYQES